ncbi:hypothetical protein BJ742DRAFT_760322 [Cladochytrium replicatum]|nr:hypothetical protein BJ742DRAFT_760322 [Cladochytrium replicatum]
MSIFDFEKQLGFYGSYHNDKTNKAIHTVFVPTILWSALVWFHNIPVGPVDGAVVGLVLFNAYYISLNAVAGLLYIPFAATLLYTSYLFNQNVAEAIPISVGIHVLSWIMQFYGHGVHEGRAPALLDNLFQSLVLAPFFVWVHILFQFGFRPDLRAKLQKQVDSSIKAWKAEKARKAN